MNFCEESFNGSNNGNFTTDWMNESTGTIAPNSSGCFTSLEDPYDTTLLPPDMTFDEDNLMSVIVYCLLFVAAAVGNLTVFLTLFRNRHRKSRVNLFIMHLSVADLIVTFIMLPLETIWHITVSWRAGDIACRLLMFFRAFGLYLSSFILVVISLDRYFAILHPLSMSDAERRGKLMILLAWLFSAVASLPQVGHFKLYHFTHFRGSFCRLREYFKHGKRWKWKASIQLGNLKFFLKT